MLIRDSIDPGQPDPLGGIVRKSLLAGGGLGLAFGLVVIAFPGELDVSVFPFAVMFGLVGGVVVGLICAVFGLVLHTFAGWFAPVLRIPAAAAGSAAGVILAAALFTNWEPSVLFSWPMLACTVAAAILGGWLTRPLRRPR